MREPFRAYWVALAPVALALMASMLVSLLQGWCICWGPLLAVSNVDLERVAMQAAIQIAQQTLLREERYSVSLELGTRNSTMHGF